MINVSFQAQRIVRLPLEDRHDAVTRFLTALVLQFEAFRNELAVAVEIHVFLTVIGQADVRVERPANTINVFVWIDLTDVSVADLESLKTYLSTVPNTLKQSLLARIEAKFEDDEFRWSNNCHSNFNNHPSFPYVQLRHGFV